ncbi:MAG TPA: UPF0149 family protein, partial [Gammaproteobacteria bacterium]|nr:UPF0149 family protein [Gammaproteobacteria bacterium]
DEADWLKELIGERDEANLQAREDVLLIAQLLREVTQQLSRRELQLQLLLPEEELLQVRAEALTSWCEGFLYGYGVSTARNAKTTESEREFLQDLMEISKLEVPEEEPTEDDELDFLQLVEHLRMATEDDELDFLQLVEHLRMGAMLLYEERHPLSDSSSPLLH